MFYFYTVSSSVEKHFHSRASMENRRKSSILRLTTERMLEKLLSIAFWHTSSRPPLPVTAALGTRGEGEAAPPCCCHRARDKNSCENHRGRRDVVRESQSRIKISHPNRTSDGFRFSEKKNSNESKEAATCWFSETRKKPDPDEKEKLYNRSRSETFVVKMRKHQQIALPTTNLVCSVVCVRLFTPNVFI